MELFVGRESSLERQDVIDACLLRSKEDRGAKYRISELTSHVQGTVRRISSRPWLDAGHLETRGFPCSLREKVPGKLSVLEGYL